MKIEDAEVDYQPWQLRAMENPAVEAHETMNSVLRTLDLANRWSRILSINCGFE